MRARKAKLRHTGTREAGHMVSDDEHPSPHDLNPLGPHAGAVLTQPGFRCLLPGGEKPGLGDEVGIHRISERLRIGLGMRMDSELSRFRLPPIATSPAAPGEAGCAHTRFRDDPRPGFPG